MGLSSQHYELHYRVLQRLQQLSLGLFYLGCQLQPESSGLRERVMSLALVSRDSYAHLSPALNRLAQYGAEDTAGPRDAGWTEADPGLMGGVEPPGCQCEAEEAAPCPDCGACCGADRPHSPADMV